MSNKVLKSKRDRNQSLVKTYIGVVSHHFLYVVCTIFGISSQIDYNISQISVAHMGIVINGNTTKKSTFFRSSMFF